MARVEPVDSDSDTGNVTNTKKKTTTQVTPKGNKGSPEVDDNASKEDGPENSDADEDEEEYEIEEIMDAKRGTFPAGRLGYLVKWKGYDSSHNSWVDEKDAGNATDLIEAFWKKPKKDRNRKSLDSKPKAAAKTPKKSPSKDEPSEVGSTSAVKKRGRPKGKTPKEDSDQEDSDHASSKKKPRKSNGVDTKAKKSGAGKKTMELTQDDEDQDMDDDTPVGNMEKYMKVPSWEHIVKTIDTVERTPKGDLDVYFRLTNGERAKQDSLTCAVRFPQKLITFYESNLRWKISDS